MFMSRRSTELKRMTSPGRSSRPAEQIILRDRGKREAEEEAELSKGEEEEEVVDDDDDEEDDEEVVERCC